MLGVGQMQGSKGTQAARTTQLAVRARDSAVVVPIQANSDLVQDLSRVGWHREHTGQELHYTILAKSTRRTLRDLAQHGRDVSLTKSGQHGLNSQVCALRVAL